MEGRNPSREPNDLLLKCLGRMSVPADHDLETCGDNHV
jgi:hypothetical protein